MTIFFSLLLGIPGWTNNNEGFVCNFFSLSFQLFKSCIFNFISLHIFCECFLVIHDMYYILICVFGTRSIQGRINNMLSLFINSCIVLISIFQEAVVTTEIAYPLAANTPAITSLIHIRNIIDPYILSSNCFWTSAELQLLYPPGVCVWVSVSDSVVAHLPFSVSARRRAKVIDLSPCSCCSGAVGCLVSSWVVEGYPREGIRPCDTLLLDRCSSGSPESCTLLYSFFICLCFRQSSIFRVSFDV